jgi:hypothetical protein
MKPLNTLPLEGFLEKARIARKSSQNSITLTTKEYNDLYDSLATIMTRLAGELDQIASNVTDEVTVISMDGGTF